jgi:hypothetical protein
LFLMASLIGLCACQRADHDSPRTLLSLIERAVRARDTGAIMLFIDKNYQDDLGGAGHVEEDLQRLFAVYGELKFRCTDIAILPEGLSANAMLESKTFHYEGPLNLHLGRTAQGWVVRAGLLTDLRGIIRTLRDRRLALERGMVDELVELVSFEYSGRPGGRTDVIERIRSQFASVRDAALVVSDLEIVVTGENAQVTQSYLLITHVDERTIEQRDREKLELRKEGTRWRLYAGIG